MWDRGKRVKVQSLKNQLVISDKCLVADSFLIRLKGLIGEEAIPRGGGVFFPNCMSVHMWFMKFSIDVIFLVQESSAQNYRITSIAKSVRPWKIFPVSDFRSAHALELPSGTAERLQLSSGDILCIS